MGVKEIRDEEITVPQANQWMGTDFSAALWEFIVRRVAYPEVKFDAEKQVILYPGYVPFTDFFQGVVDEIRQGAVDVRPCGICARQFDVNTDTGIFARPDALEGFICENCARQTSAWDFFNDHLG